MSTRSFVGRQCQDGSVQYIYCHYDGYVAGGVGQMLLEHYQNPVKVRELIALGNISSLGREIGVKHDMDWHRQVTPESRHNDPRRDWTCAYGRDGGQGMGDNAASYVASPEAFLELSDCDYYRYLYSNDGKWLVNSFILDAYGMETVRFVPIDVALEVEQVAKRVAGDVDGTDDVESSAQDSGDGWPVLTGCGFGRVAAKATTPVGSPQLRLL